MRTLIFILFMAAVASSQVPPIEPGVSHELAKWRAARYSDVRYKLNLTLEKMSPVLKGTMEIRVKVRESGSGGVEATQGSEPGASGVPAGASPSGVKVATGFPPQIILDWRKIKGSESLSTISNVSLNGHEVKNPVATAPGSDPDHLVFRDGVVLGENVIKLDFTSPILTSGSAITRYVDKEDGAEYIYSLFVPSDASTAFPVFDQPDLKARFTTVIFAPLDWNVISNFEGVHSFPDIPKTRQDFTFFGTKPISTYVFAFAAGPFDSVSDPSVSVNRATIGIKQEARDAYKRWLVNDVSIMLTPKEAAEFQKTASETPSAATGANPASRSMLDSNIQRDANAQFTTPANAGKTDLPMSIYVRKSQAAKFKPHAAEVFRLNREGIKYLEEYFDYKFPFPKYDIVLIPEFPFGGMEHAGATFLREDRVIFPTEPSANDYITRANLIFHEAAHQWFGNTVTMRWFDDLWLKEGFAEFMAYKTLEKVMPEYNAWKIFYERNKQAAYLTDSTKGTTPIYQPIANLNAAKSAYGNIVYRKAPSFLKQAEFYIGPSEFQAAVRSLLKKHEFANAGWEDLVKEFEKASGRDLRRWASVWVRTTRMPRVTSFSNKNEFCWQWANDHNWDQDLKVRVYIHFPDGSSKTADGGYKATGEVGFECVNVQRSDGDFFFANYQDYGYGIFILNKRDRDYVLKNIHNEKDDFLRSMMWGSLWDSVREAELDPKEYVELVLRVLSTDSSKPPAAKRPAKAGFQSAMTQNGETDESTIQTLLGRVSTALNYYVSDDERGQLAAKFEDLLIDQMQKAATPGQRITYFRAFLNNAVTERGRLALKQMIADSTPSRTGKGTPPRLPLRTKDRFEVVTRLAMLGDPEAAKLLAEVERTETSDEAARYAYAARAAFGTAANKAKYWNDFVNDKKISESWIEAAFVPFNSVSHAALTQPYLTRALTELPNLKRDRKIFFINGWLAAFIGGQRDEKAFAIVNKFLADNPNLDNDLRLKILENLDLIERAVKIRGRK